VRPGTPGLRTGLAGELHTTRVRRCVRRLMHLAAYARGQWYASRSVRRTGNA
jgi:hypothetical protein